MQKRYDSLHLRSIFQSYLRKIYIYVQGLYNQIKLNQKLERT
jgi:hypothetical protein